MHPSSGRVSLAAFILTVLFVAEANAAARSFFKPRTFDGSRLTFCRADTENCGKAIADAWCRDNNYVRALLFQRETLKEGCTGNQCILFRQIKCWVPADRN